MKPIPAKPISIIVQVAGRGVVSKVTGDPVSEFPSVTLEPGLSDVSYDGIDVNDDGG